VNRPGRRISLKHQVILDALSRITGPTQPLTTALRTQRGGVRARTSRKARRHALDLALGQQAHLLPLRKNKAKKKKKKLARRKRLPPIRRRRILWLLSRRCQLRNVKICWMLLLSTLTRIFETPKAIGLAAGNMYAQNVH
jgi:hypothetical protein